MRETRDAGLITNPTPDWMIDNGAYRLLLRRPAVNPEDDHFDSKTLDPKWLAWGTITTASLTMIPGWLSLNGTYIQPIPAGDWSIETETVLPTLTGTYMNSSLLLASSANKSSSTAARFYFGDGGSLNSIMLRLDKLVNGGWNTQYLAGVTGTMIFPDLVYLKIQKVGTTYSFLYTFNPLGRFKTYGSITAASLGFTPTYFGIWAQGDPLFNYFLRY
jgi:hypothetical protein